MFCPQCATENAQTLKFCTRCGANLEAVQKALVTLPAVSRKSESLIGPEQVKFILWAIMLVALLGITLVTAMVVTLSEDGIREPVLPLLGMFGYLSVITVIALLVRLLFRRGSKEDVGKRTAERALMTSPAYLPPDSVGSTAEQPTSRIVSEQKRTTS